MKRAEKEERERRLAEQARNAAEWVALRALLDRRIPEAGSLVRDMNHPLLRGELAARGSGPTGVTHATDMLRRYAHVIAQHTRGDAQSVQVHFTELIGGQLAAGLGIRRNKLKVTGQPAARGDTILELKLGNPEVIALADYLVSPDHLNLANLPINPFASPRMAGLMDRIKDLNQRARHAPDNPYTRWGGSETCFQLRYRVEKLAAVAANELSRAMPSNEARKAALSAMRLDDCLREYTPGMVGQVGWQDIDVHGTDPVTRQSVITKRKIAVYGPSHGEPGSPTRYAAATTSRDLQVSARLLSFYDG